MTTKNKKHNIKSKKSRKSDVLGLGDKYYNSASNSNSVDSVDKGMKTALTTLGIPNSDKHEKGQNGWLAISFIGIITTILLGFTAVKHRLN